MTIRKGKTIIAGNIPAGYEIGDIGLSAIGIDESLNYRRYLNGQEILQAQFPEFTKKIKRRVELYPSLACSDYQYETYLLTSAHGQCGKFVIDDERGVIRLPKVVNVMGLSDMAEAGVTVDAGLPNIEGSLIANSNCEVMHSNATASGAFKLEATEDSKVQYNGTGSNSNLYLDASLSNPIYGNSETVQQEAIKYPYFIQVASSSETTINLTRDIELNNPFSLFEYKFSEYAIDNISWLESKGQWNSNKVYVSAYEELLAIYNGKVREGVSVKKTTETYTDYDFVIDEAVSTFRLPLKVLGASSKAVAGNGLTLGLTDGSGNNGALYETDANYISSRQHGYGLALGNTAADGDINYTFVTNEYLGVTTDPTKSGIETSAEGMKLYFYVGETVQDGNLINAGAVLEDVNTLKNTALTTNQITNCITEIPQRIKLELADGVLTLKAGSEVIIPNGFEEDGVTPKFDYVTIEKDSTVSYGGTHTSTGKVCYDKDLDRIIFHWDNSITSGTTTPTKTYSFCYNTTDNKVYNIMEEGTCYQASLPLCQVAVANADGIISSIDQIFNGIGYIGSHVWVDKGVKGYYPNGFDEKGAYKSAYFESKQFCIRDLLGQNSRGLLAGFYLNSTGDYIFKPTLNSIKYNPQKNIIEWPENNEQYFSACLGTAVLDPSSGIKDFTAHTPSKALSSNDGGDIAECAMPSSKYITLTLGASGTTYTAPANGWFHFGAGSTTSTAKWIQVRNITAELASNSYNNAGWGQHCYVPCSKGDTIEVAFTKASGDFSYTYLYFHYAQGEI